MQIEAQHNVSGRLAELLQHGGVHYDALVHDDATEAQRAAAAAHVPGRYMAKVVALIGGTGEPFVVVLPAPLRVDERAIERALGCHVLRLLADDDIDKLFPDCEKGAVPPFGWLYGLPTFVDACLAHQEWIYFASGSQRQTFGMRWPDYERLARPVVGAFCFHERSKGGPGCS